MNVRTALGLLLGLTAGFAAAPVLVRKLTAASEPEYDGELPLSLAAAREFMKDPDAALEEMMKLWEEGLSEEDRALLGNLDEDNTSPRRR